MSKRMAKVASAFSILWFGFFLISCILLFFFLCIDPLDKVGPASCSGPAASPMASAFFLLSSVRARVSISLGTTGSESNFPFFFCEDNGVYIVFL